MIAFLKNIINYKNILGVVNMCNDPASPSCIENICEYDPLDPKCETLNLASDPVNLGDIYLK